MSLTQPPVTNEERQRYYDRIGERNLAPLWTVLSSLITPEPKSSCLPWLWRYADIKPCVVEAGGLITAKEAERRVLVLENPGLVGQSRITTSLYAGVQLVLPGEVAPAHRHSQSALRFVLEGDGAHTSVNGERTEMRYGDFILTPPLTWHDHGNNSADPIIWLDVLDLPMVSFFDASFAQAHPRDEHFISRPNGDSQARYGANMLPIDYVPQGKTSPIFSYPYSRSREALEVMRRGAEWDPCHGLKLRYTNPATGDFAMSTIASFLQLLPKGFVTAQYRSTDATIFVVVEGTGTTVVGDQTFHWAPRDVFIVPSWNEVSHRPDTDAVLFSCSDRAAQEKLGFFRENRGNGITGFGGST